MLEEANRLATRRRIARRPRRALQRAKRLLRIPPWADLAAIAEVYRRAAALTLETGEQHEVDHDIPLLGALASGLHVETNLRIVRKAVNREKGNSFEPFEVVGGAGIEPATSTV